MPKKKIRKIFAYLAIIAIVLGVVGAVILIKSISGNVVQENSYSLEEISHHNSERDCWEINQGKVYDVTLLVQIYPGDLEYYCGKELNLSLDKSLLHQYEIGKLG